MTVTVHKSHVRNKLNRRSILGAMAALVLALPTMVCAETVGVFFDPGVEQIKFAAGDVKAALEKHAFTVEMLPLTLLNGSYPNKKVVLALTSDRAVTAELAAQGGAKVADLGKQAYALRTTDRAQKSYWAAM